MIRLLLLTLVACGPRAAKTTSEAPEAPVATKRAPAEAPTEEPSSEPTPAPSATPPPPAADAEVTAIRDLLLARHSQDVPGRKTLELTSTKAWEVLSHLAKHDPELVVAARATERLGLWGDPSVPTLVAMLSAPGHAKLKAAAAQGLAHCDLERHTDARDKLLALVRGDDTRLAAEAAMALRGVASVREELDAIAEDEATPNLVREAIRG